MLNIRGKHIVLRDWTSKDFEIYRNWQLGQHPWHQLNAPYFPQKTSEAIDLEIQKLEQIGGHTPKPRIVIADRQTNTLIGTVNWYWQSEHTHWISIGIGIYDDEEWGKGFGYEALGLWIDHLFNQFDKIVRLDLRTWSGNIGMIKLAEKLGFHCEAKFRNARIVNDTYYDSLAYGILKTEWHTYYPNTFKNIL